MHPRTTLFVELVYSNGSCLVEMVCSAFLPRGNGAFAMTSGDRPRSDGSAISLNFAHREITPHWYRLVDTFCWLFISTRHGSAILINPSRSTSSQCLHLQCLSMTRRKEFLGKKQSPSRPFVPVLTPILAPDPVPVASPPLLHPVKENPYHLPLIKLHRLMINHESLIRIGHLHCVLRIYSKPNGNQRHRKLAAGYGFSYGLTHIGNSTHLRRFWSF